MDKKISITALLLFFLLAKLYAQKCDTASSEHVYSIYSARQSNATLVLPGDNSEAYLFGNLTLPNGYTTDGIQIFAINVFITKLNGKGTPLWTKYLKDGFRVPFMSNATRSLDGGFLITGTVVPNDHPNQNSGWLAKLDANGNVQWTFVLGTPLSTFAKAISLQDGGVAVVGSLQREYEFADFGGQTIGRSHAIILKIDANGKQVWARDFYEDVNTLGGANMYTVLQTRDGNIVASGMKDADLKGPHRVAYGFLMKFDNGDGHTIWQTQSPDVTAFHSLSLGNGDTLILRSYNHIYFADASTGNLLKSNDFIPKQLYGVDYDFFYAGSIAEGKDIYYSFSNRAKVVLFQLENYDTLTWMRAARTDNGDGHVTELRSVALQKGSIGNNIYLEGDFSNGGLSYSFLSKIAEDARALCMDTFALNIAFVPKYWYPLTPFRWQYEYQLAADVGKVIITDDTLFTLNKIYCYTVACCRDTTVNIDTTICEGSNYVLPDGRKISKNGRYSFSFKRSSGCDSIIFITLTTVPPAKPNLGGDTCLPDNKPIRLRAHAHYASSYLWQDGSTDSMYVPTIPGDYWVQAKNVCGTISDTVTVLPTCDFPIYIPSAFTPNGDGRNDVFRILNMRGQQLIDFSIYNRWGQCVFRTSDAQKGWDGIVSGRIPETATFVYVIHYADLVGRGKYVKGLVNLIR